MKVLRESVILTVEAEIEYNTDQPESRQIALNSLGVVKMADLGAV